MKDPLNIEQLRRQRTAIKKKLERMVRDGASAEEFGKMEKYLKLLDRRIEIQTDVRC